MKMYLCTNVQRYTKNNRHTVSIRDVLAVCAYYDLGLYYFGFIAQKKKKKRHKITAFDLHSFEQLFEPLSARHTHTHAHHLNTVQSQSQFGKLNVRSFIKLKAVKSQINQ